MTMTENANLIQILETLGWTGEQINKLQLGIDGRISVKEAAELIEKQGSTKTQ
ncbi:MAG: hypothetical protein IJ682_06220 [Lachnospiraceae bacterium]|nr:hypothetical protein [Lachnospiraceae bacterium]